MSLGSLRALPITVRVPMMAALLMVLVGIVASQQVLSALTETQEARLRELARFHVDGLSVALGPSVLRNDVWEVYDTLDRARSASEGRRMVLTAVADSSQHILAATDPRRAPLGSLLTVLSQGALPLEEITLDRISDRIRVLAPLVFQGRVVGEIMTELDVADLAAERQRAVVYLILFNALATGLIAFGGYLVMRRMLKPVSTLAQHMTVEEGIPAPIPAREIPQGDTEVARLLRTYNDMTDAIAAKADAERRLAERERLVSLGRLSSSLAHEINNPLGGLLNATDTIRRYADRSDVVRQSAELLERGLKHLRDVSRATLDHNRLQSGDAVLKATDFDDLRLLLGPEVQRLSQRLDWVVDWREDEGRTIGSAPVRQVILNLLLNASAAAGEGGQLGLSVARDGAQLSLHVSNDGPEMPETAIRRLTEAERSAPGNGGVGLRIVYDLVMRAGGQITHQRRQEKTYVTVTLPLHDAKASG